MFDFKQLLVDSGTIVHCINWKNPLLWVSHWYGQKRHQHDCGVIIILVISSQAELLLLVSAILAKWPVPTGTLKLGHAQKGNIFKTVSIHLKYKLGSYEILGKNRFWTRMNGILVNGKLEVLFRSPMTWVSHLIPWIGIPSHIEHTSPGSEMYSPHWKGIEVGTVADRRIARRITRIARSGGASLMECAENFIANINLTDQRAPWCPRMYKRR